MLKFILKILHQSNSALQFFCSYSTSFPFIKDIQTSHISYMYNTNNSVPIKESCGTSDVTDDDTLPSIITDYTDLADTFPQ